ncbi:MAG: HpcH/HpaI aldolase/citrate lyase family protein [Acidimicrobiales bacterium]
MTGRLRSLLFAPATRPDLIAKLPRSRPDGVVIDLEDAVAPDAKAEGRANVQAVLPELIAAADAPDVFVRVNAVGTPWFDDDVDGGLCDGVAGVVVPKLASADDVATVAGALARHGRSDLVVVGGIESAAGVLDVNEVLASPVAAVYFGAEDFVSDMGGTRRPDNLEVLYARSRVALAARVAGVVALDMIVSDFGDLDRFRREAAEARALGYSGKLCIHPSQVAAANEAFVPSSDEVERARRIVAAHDHAVAHGQAAVAVDGQMVDEPLARQARAVIAADDAARSQGSGT